MLKDPSARRKYWEWFESTSLDWRLRPTGGIGDMNADPRRRETVGGGALARLADSGWQMSDPTEPWSFVSGSRLDHAWSAKASHSWTHLLSSKVATCAWRDQPGLDCLITRHCL